MTRQPPIPISTARPTEISPYPKRDGPAYSAARTKTSRYASWRCTLEPANHVATPSRSEQFSFFSFGIEKAEKKQSRGFRRLAKNTVAVHL
jgi:hypothetical protein